MQLVRLTLDLRNPRVRRDVADAYDMHRSLVRAFVMNEHSEPPRFLWRLEPESTWREPIVIVQSNHESDWSELQSSGYLKKPAESKIVHLEPLLRDSGRYRFRLFANPTVTQGGKRYGLADEDAQLSWLDRQGEKAGFQVETALVTSTDVMDVRRGDICLRQARFEGVLNASDCRTLCTAIEQGIGPGKAFGFGLLSVSPRG